MRLIFNIEKKYLYSTLGFILIVGIAIFVAAQNSLPNPGHRVGEIGCDPDAQNCFLLLDSTTSDFWGIKLRGNGGRTDAASFMANGSTGEVRIGGILPTYFPTFYSGNSEAMRITTAGNVGIGTTGPGTKLHVYNGASGQSGFGAGIVTESNTHQYINLVSAANMQQGVTFGNPTSLSYAGMLWEDGSRGNLLQFKTGNTVRVTIDNNGNVGIGATSPGYKLDVVGDINLGSTNVYLRGGTAGVSKSCTTGYTPDGITTSGGIVTSAGTCVAIGGGRGISGSGTDNYIPRWLGTNSLENSVIYQTDTGNVGIGTTDPTEKLEVNGNVKVAGNVLFGYERVSSSTRG
ncbi:MAG: hypothetical protein AABX90_01775, partial [Nanoarchaeota archaeon]